MAVMMMMMMISIATKGRDGLINPTHTYRSFLHIHIPSQLSTCQCVPIARSNKGTATSRYQCFQSKVRAGIACLAEYRVCLSSHYPQRLQFAYEKHLLARAGQYLLIRIYSHTFVFTNSDSTI